VAPPKSAQKAFWGAGAGGELPGEVEDVLAAQPRRPGLPAGGQRPIEGIDVGDGVGVGGRRGHRLPGGDGRGD
jgi:hypothetical protein